MGFWDDFVLFFYFKPPYAVQNVRTQTPVVLSMDQLVVYYMGF